MTATAPYPSKEQIIKELFTGKNFRECISKMEPAHLRDDLKQEVILIVCEWPGEKVISLYEQKKLEFYVVKVILNMLTNKYSSFHKQFRNRPAELITDEVQEESDFEERAYNEMIEQLAIDELELLEKRDWYAHGLIKLYQKHGTFRAIQNLTGIPYVSCYKTIKKAMQELRQRAVDPAARPVKKTQNVRS